SPRIAETRNGHFPGHRPPRSANNTFSKLLTFPSLQDHHGTHSSYFASSLSKSRVLTNHPISFERGNMGTRSRVWFTRGWSPLGVGSSVVPRVRRNARGSRMGTTRRSGWGAPALWAIALLMSLPALADAQLFPRLPIRRERVPCALEPPVYKLY